MPLLFGAVEDRAWISDMADYLSGRRDTPPAGDGHQYRLGDWLDQGGRALLSDERAADMMEALHRDIHHLAAELVELKRNGRTDEVHKRISELHRLRDQLLEQLGA